MAATRYPYASQLRLELCRRNRVYANGLPHAETRGPEPVIVYSPRDGRHGNFFDAAYTAISTRPEWMRRLEKVHAQAGRALPRAERRWRELDSSVSSDALLMNIFCTPGVVESRTVQGMLGVDTDEPPAFGWRARVPLRNGRVDQSEIDMRWGSLLVEAKLTEADFQTRAAGIVEAYRDFDEVFDRDLLPRTAMVQGRRREIIEFPEEFTQEEVVLEGARWQPPAVDLAPGSTPGYRGYQLIRYVLAAHAVQAELCVLLDGRRPDLIEAWFEVMAAVRHAALRVRLKVLTWQELAAVLPRDLAAFLELKCGILA